MAEYRKTTQRGDRTRLPGGKVSLVGSEFWKFMGTSLLFSAAYKATERFDWDSKWRNWGMVGVGAVGLGLAIKYPNKPSAVVWGKGAAMASLLYVVPNIAAENVGTTESRRKAIARQFPIEELEGVVEEKKKQLAEKEAKELAAFEARAKEEGLVPEGSDWGDYEAIDTWKPPPSGVTERILPGGPPSGKGMWWGWYPVAGVVVVGTAWALYARHAAKTPIKWPFFGK